MEPTDAILQHIMSTCQVDREEAIRRLVALVTSFLNASGELGPGERVIWNDAMGELWITTRAPQPRRSAA